ncbi:hypothetical protein GCM10012284_28250 [Mangrovihabitans endophyticus]|uniref:Uncharacterized protein n=1 Tax=Mangrovihabitans endophyticus TaxID=1751298 RepID=A0A8J3FP48_9ACTN|nr:hypothetical protein GCM10012284_28250 [Mangrovihabitans endophyticus]
MRSGGRIGSPLPGHPVPHELGERAVRCRAMGGAATRGTAMDGTASKGTASKGMGRGTELHGDHRRAKWQMVNAHHVRHPGDGRSFIRGRIYG